MLAKDFIFERLHLLSIGFPSVQIKYRFNDHANTHIVELSPLSAYDHDRALENAWIQIVKDFMEIFPKEDISFIGSDSTLRINAPELVFNIPTPQYISAQCNSYSQLKKLLLWNILDNFNVHQSHMEHPSFPFSLVTADQQKFVPSNRKG